MLTCSCLVFQLTVAKQLVEKRMQGLWGSGGTAQSPSSSDADVTLPGQKVQGGQRFLLVSSAGNAVLFVSLLNV